MQKGPEFSIKESRIATEKEAFKLTKKFLKIQDDLSREMDSNKKIAAVSEDVLANLNIIVEKMQKDTTEYIEKFASKPDSQAMTTPAPEDKTEKQKSSKKRHREEETPSAAVVVKTEAAAEAEVKSSKKKKKKKSESD